VTLRERAVFCVNVHDGVAMRATFARDASDVVALHRSAARARAIDERRGRGASELCL